MTSNRLNNRDFFENNCDYCFVYHQTTLLFGKENKNDQKKNDHTHTNDKY